MPPKLKGIKILWKKNEQFCVRYRHFINPEEILDCFSLVVIPNQDQKTLRLEKWGLKDPVTFGESESSDPE